MILKNMQAYKTYFADKNFVMSFVGGFVLLTASLYIQFLTSGYVTRVVSGPVTDIVLSNTRVYDVGTIFVWGAVILAALGVALCIRHIHYTPFMAKSIAIFTITRAIFVSLTHISPFPTHALIDSTGFSDKIFSGIFTGNDLFFSGHTGVPFLLALMFWDHKILRYVFLCFSVLFAIVVLLGHLHYSIDVLSAYFITYAIFHICRELFKKDWALFLKKEF